MTATPSITTHSDNTPVAVDVYLAEYTERIPGLYLQPGWIASVSLPHTKTVTYGDVKSLLYNNTELEVSLYLTEFTKRGLVHASNFSTLRLCNLTCLWPTALNFGGSTVLSLHL